jgi:UDP-glucose 4-epimerase
MTKKVFVTGGAGYIGSHTCLELLNSNHIPIVFDNLCNSSKESLRRIEVLTNKKIEFVHGDIRDQDYLIKTMSHYQPDVVIHFAGLKAVGESTINPLLYYDVNVRGSINLLNAMNSSGCNQIVFSSSATVYGGQGRAPFKEIDEKKPISPYGRTKLQFEHILKDWMNSDSRYRAIALRYFNPLGAHQSGVIGEYPSGIPNNLMPFIMQVAQGQSKNLLVFGNDYPTRDGTGERDYIHVVDLAKGHVRALEKINNLKFFQAYNLGTGRGTTVLELVKAFEECTGLYIPIQLVDRRDGDVAISLADPTTAKSVLNFECKKSIKDMCVDTWNWQHKNPHGYKL